MYTCRECEQPLNQATEVCPYCGADLTAPPVEEIVAPKKKRALARSFVIWGILIACVWAIVLFVLPPRPETAQPEAEKSAVAAIVAVHSALSSYASATGGYPASLEALGEATRSAAQSAQSAGYDIQYAPALVREDAPIRSFTLVARPGNYGYRNFFTDESGIIRATRENRAATAQDPEYK
ncbi:MAG: hypothetical protein WA755_09270 [Candidatus Acidiferrales bacterium]